MYVHNLAAIGHPIKNKSQIIEHKLCKWQNTIKILLCPWLTTHYNIHNICSPSYQIRIILLAAKHHEPCQWQDARINGLTKSISDNISFAQDERGDIDLHWSGNDLIWQDKEFCTEKRRKDGARGIPRRNGCQTKLSNQNHFTTAIPSKTR